MLSSAVKVAVRVRPVLDNSEQRIRCEEGGLTVLGPCLAPSHGDTSGKRRRSSVGPRAPIDESAVSASTWHFDCVFDDNATQKDVFASLGTDLVDSILDGYNCCVFAYGQTGAGKTHTMVGRRRDPGLIPRLCKALYDRIEEESEQTIEYKLEISLVEVYNESLRDLLAPTESNDTLRVREHPVTGPYVDGLTHVTPTSLSHLLALIEEGFSSRVTAATEHNETSSRSHAVFTITLRQRVSDPLSGLHFDRMSKFNLIDLAGSERASKSKGNNVRFKETREINSSLLTIGRVINMLAEGTSNHIPYRDSTITWLLRESLGGNSHTVMIALVNGTEACHEETVSTLRYASRAKCIVNVAQVNEDPNARLISELRAEIEALKAGGAVAGANAEETTNTFAHPAVVELSRTVPYLVNISKSVSARSPILFHLEPHITVGSGTGATVKLPGLLSTHADIQTRAVSDEPNAGVSVILRVGAGADVAVNGVPVANFHALSDGEIVQFGSEHVFWFRDVQCTDTPSDSPTTTTAAILNFLSCADTHTAAVYAACFPHTPIDESNNDDVAERDSAIVQAVTPKGKGAASAESVLSPPRPVDVLKRERDMYKAQLRALQNTVKQSDRELAYSLEEYSRLKVRSDRAVAALEARLHELEGGSAVNVGANENEVSRQNVSASAESRDLGRPPLQPSSVANSSSESEPAGKGVEESEGVQISGIESRVHAALSELGIHVPLPVLETLSPSVWSGV